MEAGEWSATDIALKTDTATVLECLQRSMADDDDEDFKLPSNSLSSYSNHLSRELLSSLPPVSELKADLSPYYSERTREVRRSTEGPGNIDLKADTGYRVTTVPDHYVSSTNTAAVSAYDQQQAAQAADATAAQFPAGSDFTTLTNASSSQASVQVTSGQNTIQQYQKVSSTICINDKTTSGDVQDYNQSQHRQSYQQYSHQYSYQPHQNQGHFQSYYYSELLVPPPPSYTSAPYLAAGTGDATYHQDSYSPQSGRQSTSCIPSDLQQVTPTIQELGTPIPNVPPPITPVPQVADATVPTTPLQSCPATGSGVFYSSIGTGGVGTSPATTLQDIGGCTRNSNGGAVVRTAGRVHESSHTGYHGSQVSAPNDYGDTPQASEASAGFSGTPQRTGMVSVSATYEAQFNHIGYPNENVATQQANHSGMNAYTNNSNNISTDTTNNAYSSSNHYGHYISNQHVGEYHGVQPQQCIASATSHQGLGCISQMKPTETVTDYQGNANSSYQHSQDGENHQIHRDHQNQNHQDALYHQGHLKSKSSKSAQQPITTTTPAAGYNHHYLQPPASPFRQTHHQTISTNDQIDYHNNSQIQPQQHQDHVQQNAVSYHNLHKPATSELSKASTATPFSSSSSTYFQQYHYTVGYHGHSEQPTNGIYQDGVPYPAGQLHQDLSGIQTHQQTQQELSQQPRQPLAGSTQTLSGSSAAQMFHDALEYIAPEVISENKDSLFNPIAALTDTLLENNFDMTFPADYQETCDTIIHGTSIQQCTETAVKLPDQLARKETKNRNRKKKKENNLLEVIKVYRCNVCGFRSSDKLKALRHTIESHSRPKLNRQARFACGACHLHFATLDTCCEHVGEKHPGMATAVLKEGKLYKQVLIQPEKRVAKVTIGSGTTGGHSKTVCAESEVQAHKIAWKRKMDREQGQYTCELKGCSIRFRLEESHRHHLRCHLPHPSKLERFRCPIEKCGLGCKRWSTMANHLWNSHRIDLELQACNRCDFRTYSLANLEKVHKLVHGEEKQFPCEQCQSRFRTIKQLKNHRYMQHSRKAKKTKTVACPHCRQELLKKNLFAHIRQVHEGRLTERNCPQCDFKTTSLAELKSHLSTVHLNESGAHCCHQCGFLTYDHNVYRKHALKHSADKPYKCAYCSYASIQATTYKAHLRKNHPERAQELIARCPHCPFESISSSRLQQHIFSRSPSNFQLHN
ncbi:uncharacterized protein LOC111250272 isoform X2 [Varroa destructor]|uniref:C2H2-type domain-containing protein n=1 Tax=Varroa destructor TaxID=109461 RepID=A0A7M7MA21_VARDE|nr:uncharacterized protein LOC111250272 isoform X2 [Varroa destructor]